ncbi:MAG: glycogen debranching N-terminal domain-containing protein [Haloarculaceae archaeon]
MTVDILVDGRTLLVGSPDSPGVDSDGDGGLYHLDTRHLSSLSTGIEGTDLTAVGRDLRSADRRTVIAASAESAVNRVDDDGHKHTDLVVRETQSVEEGAGLTGRLVVANHSPSTFTGRLTVEFGTDFADVFEVRGFSTTFEREIQTTVAEDRVRYEYEYESADDTPVSLTTTVSFDRTPATLEPGTAAFDLEVPSQETTAVTYRVRPNVTPVEASAAGVADPERDGGAPLDLPSVTTGRRDRDRVFDRARQDLAALTTVTEHGPVPLAGTPWFATVFGRDSLIAAYQTLPVAPALAAGTLRYLAAYRGTTTNEATEEGPGKVFHEMRHGELARRGEVPHTPYYGSVDATPLWVALLAETYRWTGDADLVTSLSAPLEDALSWIDRTRDGEDPFLYYEQSPGVGLLHKAWRDTPGAVQFPDGELAESPIASVEVQGYVYRALRDAAMLYEEVFGDGDRATALRAQADTFAAAFESAFWVPEREFYAVAKVGEGRTVPTRTSNVAHCLWSGIVPEERADAVARTLRSSELYSGWGLRTMAASAAGYSPVSYHLGSVWPHDTSLAALGLARYGFHDDAERLAEGVLDAATQFEDDRIPELFCGFDDEVSPKPYPSSCVPQAWSAGAPYALLRASFALEPTGDGVRTASDSALFPADAIEGIREQW